MMSNEPFLRPRLTGARFEGHAIPLEFLQDLSTLQEMITEVAKLEYRKDHPERQRSPRGFTEGIELKLTGIEAGSAVPVIDLVVTPNAPTLFPPENQIYFTQARDAIINAIGAAEQQQNITAFLPEKILSYFDRMGRSLREGEAMEFTSPARPNPARLTKDTRRRLVLASANELTEETAVRGSIPEVDQKNNTFQVQIINGPKVTAPLTPQHRETILQAFNEYLINTRVLLQGIGRFTRSSRMLSFDSIEHVSIMDPLDVPARLDEFRSLHNGWLEGHGLAPTSAGLDWLASAFDQYYPLTAPLPYLYPTEEGRIQAEWSIDANEISLVIDLSACRGQWHRLNMATDKEEMTEIDLHSPESWRQLGERLQQMGGGIA